ncbi:unnamed protein product [Linum trigynum]|uniref:Integrase catalytic domain-containing protein n=1 Tax=Linum trigynum TaxID=586398 RepID=A0AAV2DX20_9ROSI
MSTEPSQSSTVATSTNSSSSTDQLVPQSIVSIKFNGRNYNLWSRSLRIALKTRKRLGYIDGSKPQPDATDASFEEWDANNTQVLGWLLNSLDETTAESVPSTENAYQIWEDLKMRYGQADAIRLADLQTQIFTCKQGSSSINEYFTKLKTYWEEYVQYRTVVCSACPQEDCPATVALNTLRGFIHDDYVMRFITGLNDNYEGVRTNLLMMKPMPSIGSAFSYVLQHERQLDPHGTGTKGDEGIALAADGSRGRDQRKGTAPSQGGLFCRYCKKDNHVKEDCWKLKAKNKKMMESGHSNFAGSVSNPTGDTSSKGNSDEEGTGYKNLKLSTEDCNRLLNLLQHSPTTSPSSTRPGSPGMLPQAKSVSRQLPTFPNFAGKLTLLTGAQSQSFKLHDMWIVDTGATDHISCNLSGFLAHKEIKNVFLTLPNGQKAEATHIGVVKLPCSIVLHQVLYVPSFSFNLISVSKLTKTLPVSLTFKSSFCEIQDLLTRRRIGLAHQVRGLYQMSQCISPIPDARNNLPTIAAAYNFSQQNLDLWHSRLGHPSALRQNIIQKSNPVVEKYVIDHCETCHFAKQKKLPFDLSSLVSVEPFDLVHVDIWGPHSVLSYNGFRYFLTVVDDYSRCLWVFLMKAKSEARKLLQDFCVMVNVHFGKRVKTIRSDQGLEFHMPGFYGEHGILHQTSCVEVPQQNGRVERKHQDILNVARALRFHAGLSLSFWGDCVLHAVFLINRLPTPLLENLTPFEKLYGKAPDYSVLRIFGCLCYAGTLSQGRKKFEKRAGQCVFLGFTPGMKGYKLLDLSNHAVFVSRDVKFYEQILPYKKDHLHPVSDSTHTAPSPTSFDPFPEPENPFTPPPENPDSPNPDPQPLPSPSTSPLENLDEEEEP